MRRLGRWKLYIPSKNLIGGHDDLNQCKFDCSLLELTDKMFVSIPKVSASTQIPPVRLERLLM